MEFLYLAPLPLEKDKEITDFKNLLLFQENNFIVLQKLANFLSEKTFSEYFAPFENLSLSQHLIKTNLKKESM